MCLSLGMAPHNPGGAWPQGESSFFRQLCKSGSLLKDVACTRYLVQGMLASPFITAHSLAWCLWCPYVVGTTQLRLILLEALPHILSLFHIRRPPDPAYLASVIDPGDELTLWGPKVFSGPFFSSLEFRQLEALPLWEPIRL